MTTELTILIAAAGLGLLQIIAASHAASFQFGYAWSAGSRDAPCPPLVGLAGRLQRTVQNFSESFCLFAVAIFVAHLLGKHNVLTITGALMYLAGRVAFLALCVTGVRIARSIAWSVAALGIVLLFVACFR